MSALGAFAFVLHCHHPFVRLGGRWHHGEEWIHDAVIETYLPLLETLYDLSEEGTPFRLTLGMSPVLAEQLSDPVVLDHLERYLDERIEAAQKDMAYFETAAFNEHLRYLAEWYRDTFMRIKVSLTVRFNRDLIGAFRRLQDEGVIELITTAATHAYLPLLSRDSSLSAQIKTAVATHTRLFGKAPTAFWLPEYGYRPAEVTETGEERAGIEQMLSANGITSFLVDTHTLTGGAPEGVAAGNVLGTYDTIARRYTIPLTDRFAVAPNSANPVAAYYAGAEGQVAVVARNARVGQQVGGNELGYPRDFDYRGSHLRSGTSGLQYWRITGAKVEAANRDVYHPDWAAYKIEQHAEHFAHLVGDQLRSYNQASKRNGLVVSSFNAELFGHWWFEGIAWMGKVLRHLANSPDVDVTTMTAFVAQHPPTERVELRESSWGIGGLHFFWDNEENRWVWEAIQTAEERMERLAERFTTPTDDEATVLAQAARELLLLQASDWTFEITTGQARAYAIRRFTEHIEHFDTLADSLEVGTPDTFAANAYWRQNNVFPDIDYRWFRTTK